MDVILFKLLNIYRYSQPIAAKPFTFEQELDDLPKETLKEMIWKEAQSYITDANEW